MNLGALVQTAMKAVPRDAKSSVVFTSSSPGTPNNADGTFTPPVAVTVTGTASRGKSNPTTYERLNLIVSEAPSLFFVPDVIGQMPGLDWTVPWGGSTYKVKDVDPVAPAGTALAATIVVSR